jgi:hypothetical protein
VRYRLWIVVLTALLIQACATGGTQEQPAEPVTPAYVPLEGVNAKARFRESLRLLANGDAEAARVELVIFRQEQPSSDVAADIIDQIDTPSSIYFPEEYQEVTLGNGVSLSSLAKQYLGSVYKFHALAKYNGIAEPRTLYPGQAIRIPLTDTARASFAADGESGMPMPEEPREDYDEPDEPMPVAEEMVIEGENAAPMEPMEVDPAEVENLHRQALNAYRGQNLDKAIALWDQVLSLDPEHENARIYRSQAQSLKKKLRNLN